MLPLFLCVCCSLLYRAQLSLCCCSVLLFVATLGVVLYGTRLQCRVISIPGWQTLATMRKMKCVLDSCVCVLCGVVANRRACVSAFQAYVQGGHFRLCPWPVSPQTSPALERGDADLLGVPAASRGHVGCARHRFAQRLRRDSRLQPFCMVWTVLTFDWNVSCLTTSRPHSIVGIY